MSDINSIESNNKIKEILTKMNCSETPLDNFYELIEKETGGKLTFTGFKTYLDKTYECVSKLDRIFLLKHISIDPSGKINLTDIFNTFAKLINQTIASPILAFYNIANIIEKKLKISTLEFIFKNGLTTDQEININDFFLKISESLKIDDITTIIVFKSLDLQKNGKIHVENLLIVIDSYREDSVITRDQSKNLTNEHTKLMHDILYFRNLLESESITVDDIFERYQADNARFHEVYNSIRMMVENSNFDIIENVLNFLKRDNKIYKKDFDSIISIDYESIDANYITNYMKKKSKPNENNKFNISDTQTFWINKLLTLLDIISITPTMAFEASISVKKSLNESPLEMNLDSFKRKLQMLIPKPRVSAIELNNIADSLDINRNKLITLDDYMEVIQIAKTDPKFSISINENLFSQKQTALINSNNPGYNLRDLPTKGNTKVLSTLKSRALVTVTEDEGSGKGEVEGKGKGEGNNFKPNNNFNTNNPISLSLHPDKVKTDYIKEFTKEVEVFENGEWNLIELLEEIPFPITSYIPSLELTQAMVKKYSPTISKEKIYNVVKSIDTNNDGFVSYIDMVSFLLVNFRHRSTKLALKAIAAKIESESQSTEDYFSTKFDNKTEEINFVKFTQLFVHNFDLHPPVVNKIFQELKKILNKSTLRVSDIIDLINEYRFDTRRSKHETVKLTPISLLDKKYYEEEMRAFVKILQKGGLICKNSNYNLGKFLSLPEYPITMCQFRNFFIKPLSMQYSLGIATFQLLKSFSTEPTIMKEDLYQLIESYIDINMEIDPQIVIHFIELNFTPISFCFELIGYTYKGISMNELLKSLENFYPCVCKLNLLSICKSIDKKRLGLITFKNLSDFIYNNSRCQPFSKDLMLKYLASILDYKNIDTRDFILSIIKGTNHSNKNISILDYCEHVELFSKLQFPIDQIDDLFHFLCNSSRFYHGYIFERLIRLVNYHRQVRREFNKSITIFDNSHQIEAIKSQALEYKEFLQLLNDNVNLSVPFAKLSIGEHLQIPIHELFCAIDKEYSNLLDLDKQLLMRFLKFIDKDKKGSVEYERLIKEFKNTFEEFEVSIVLHFKYLSEKINKEYHMRLKDYLAFKGLTPNKYLTFMQFELLFKQDECLNEDSIVYNMFEYLKEKKGTNTNLLFIQNLIDSLTVNQNVQSSRVSLSDEDAIDILKSTIYRMENNDVKFSSFFDKINMINVNQFGKLNAEFIKLIMNNFYIMDEATINIFCGFFSKILNLFDLFKLIDFIQFVSEKSKVYLDDLVNFIKEKIPRDKTVELFSKTYNLNLNNPLLLRDVCLLFKALFGITTYDCCFIFKEIVHSDENIFRDDFRFSLDFFFKYFSIYKLFKKEDIVQSNEIKIDPSSLLSLKKLYIYLESLPNKMAFFKKFDIDKSGVLSKEEFYEMLKSCEKSSLNDSQMIKILNLADKNNDGSINYIEFVDFLNKIKSELGLTEPTESSLSNKYVQLISKESSNIQIQPISHIDFNKLKENYEFNLKHIDESSESSLNNFIYHIQEHLFDTINKEKNLESQLISNDINSSDSIPKFHFFDILNKLKFSIDEELEEKIWNFSMEGYLKKVKNNFLVENLVPYRNFLNNVTIFKVSDKEIFEKEKTNSDPKPNKVKIENETKLMDALNINNKITKHIDEIEKNKEVSTKLIHTDFNNKSEIDNAKNHLKETFTIKFHTNKTQNTNGLKGLINNLEKLEYNGYDYEINPTIDYFDRKSKKIPTILNCEDAAIKKCEELYNECTGVGGFIDKDFGSQVDDNGTLHKTSLYFTGVAPKGYLAASMIEWYRTSEICETGSPQFILDGSESNDVCQGAIGDCWFISALSVLATKDHLLRGEVREDILNDGVIDEEECVMLSTGVYPPLFQFFRKRNIFCFRFYKNFSWRYVIVDDRLPCRKVFNSSQPKSLIFGKCKNPSEFWVPLIEKAYAKLHGCYEALISGFVDDGLVDLTGLTARKIPLSNEDFSSLEKIENIWKIITKNVEVPEKQNIKAKIIVKNNTMMGCSIDAKTIESEVVINNHKTGVLAGHAYGILDTLEIPKPNSIKSRKTSRLLRIRNPWGYKEWNGKWSDESAELSRNKEMIQKALDDRYKETDEKINLDAEDGTFLMCYSDFRKIYNKLFFCIDFTNSYVGMYLHDKWTKEESGGIPINNTPEELTAWAKNPQYYFQLKKDSEVFISLLQPDGRLYGTKFPYSEYTLKNCLILSKAKGKIKLPKFENDSIITISPVRQHRENSVVIKLERGEYIISACTFKSGEIGEFVLEIHYEDSFIDSDYDDTNFTTKLKNSWVERLGGKVKAEIKKETNIDELRAVTHKKQMFLYDKFKHMLMDMGNMEIENFKPSSVDKSDDDFDQF